MRPRVAPRIVVTAAAAVVGLIGGGAVGFVTGGSNAQILGSGSGPPAPTVRPVAPDTLLAWTPGGLPSGFAGRVRRLGGVVHVTAVRSGVAWLTRS